MSSSKARIGIPALPCGNFSSVVKIVEKAGGRADIVQDPKALEQYGKVIVAGVGAFDHGMDAIRDRGWLGPLDDAAKIRKVPILGICLGMLMLCEDSEEGVRPGLGWIPGHVRKFRPAPGSALKVPHMGWNTIEVRRPNPILEATASEQRFYFVHSFHAVCTDPSDVIAVAHHGIEFSAAIGRGNVLGAQFHPEKSHRFGLALMRRFVEIPC
jgi:glutamine amidotransferase